MESTTQTSNDPGTTRERERNGSRTGSNPDRAADGRLMYYEHQVQPMGSDTGELGLSIEDARVLLEGIVDATGICSTFHYPLPPAGLPGFLHDDVSRDDPAAKLIEIGMRYVKAVASNQRRAMHLRWREAADFIYKIECDTEARIREQLVAEQMRWSERQQATPTHIYFIGAASGAIKIGISVSPQNRLSGLQTSHHEKLSILATLSGDMDTEREYHKQFAEYRLNGEWFSRAPEILAEIDRLNHGAQDHG